MKSILFLPLNTNHVLIFQTLLKYLDADYIFVSHDNVSESKQYQTGKLLDNLSIPFIHFPKRINRSLSDSTLSRISKFFRLKKGIIYLLDEVKPSVIVMAIDNDPINQIFLTEAKKRSIKTILMQEALIRPLEYTMRPAYRSDIFMKLLRKAGIFINYIPYGSGGCDKILVGGMRPYNILKSRGIAGEILEITGLPKYDDIIKKLTTHDHNNTKSDMSFLYIASTLVVYDDAHIDFLKTLASIAEKNEIKLIVKLHPRTEKSPDDIYKIIGKNENNYLHILKGGDETSTLLKKVTGMITVSSTVILDALMLNKKCVVVDYLAGESQLQYDSYDAVFQISSKKEIELILNEAIKQDKKQSNKITLLEDELYKLDGQSAERAADLIKNFIKN